MNEDQHIVVVGAGVVGLSCALWLRRSGFSVSIVDPQPPGSGTSSGNACSIAEYGCIPVNSPDIIRRLPHLLSGKDKPLVLNPFYVLQHLTWMIDFLRHCRTDQVKRSIEGLAQLLNHTWDGLTPLLNMARAGALVEQRGFLQLFQDQDEFRRVLPATQIRQKFGAEIRTVGAEQIRELEPKLKYPFQHGLLFENTSQVLDPLALCQQYAQCLEQHHCRFIPAKVMEIQEETGHINLILDNGDSFLADQVVVAAGAFTKFIGGLGNLARKIDTERGYHVLYQGQQQLLSRPVSWHFSGFYATPMNLGLRIAGTVEIAGYSKKPNLSVTNYLSRKAKKMFDLPADPDKIWLGFRPTFPDSLPAIGYAAASTRVIIASGHHHLGLTLSGITGKLVAEIAAGVTPSLDLTPYDPKRFA